MQPVHPGEILREELNALGMSAKAFAEALDVPGNRITAILKGQRGVTADTALRLSRYLGTSAERWLNLQKSFELRVAELQSGEQIAKSVKPRGKQRPKGAIPAAETMAAKYVWWKEPTEALQNKHHFLAQLMTLGTLEDVQWMVRSYREEELKEALEMAPPGIFNGRSWNFWHLRLGIAEVPELPARNLASP